MYCYTPVNEVNDAKPKRDKSYKNNPGGVVCECKNMVLNGHQTTRIFSRHGDSPVNAAQIPRDGYFTNCLSDGRHGAEESILAGGLPSSCRDMAQKTSDACSCSALAGDWANVCDVGSVSGQRRGSVWGSAGSDALEEPYLFGHTAGVSPAMSPRTPSPVSATR